MGRKENQISDDSDDWDGFTERRKDNSSVMIERLTTKLNIFLKVFDNIAKERIKKEDDHEDRIRELEQKVATKKDIEELGRRFGWIEKIMLAAIGGWAVFNLIPSLINMLSNIARQGNLT